MDFSTFRRANPATRCFQRYSHLDRADMAASHRMGHRQREAVGEFFYTHPLVPGLAFPTRTRAEQVAFEKTISQDGIAMTDYQFEYLRIVLTSIANDLSAIRGLIEKMQAPVSDARTANFRSQVLSYAARVNTESSRIPSK